MTCEEAAKKIREFINSRAMLLHEVTKGPWMREMHSLWGNDAGWGIISKEKRVAWFFDDAPEIGNRRAASFCVSARSDVPAMLFCLERIVQVWKAGHETSDHGRNGGMDTLLLAVADALDEMRSDP